MHPFVRHQVDAVRRPLAATCERTGVKRLQIFGSATGSHFEPSSSDLDLLVEFFEDQPSGIADRYLTLAETLERLFQRKVDLLTSRSLQNPHLRVAVTRSAQTIYEA
jgi:predicted nucleotidyltransferase